jgi:hypothetical protein
VTACVCNTVPSSSAGLSLTSLWMLLPSNAASSIVQVQPGPSPLPPPWPVAPPWVKFCILAIGLTPRLTSGFITPSKVRFSFFGFRKIDFPCLHWLYIGLGLPASTVNRQVGTLLVLAESIESEGSNAFLPFFFVSDVVQHVQASKRIKILIAIYNQLPYIQL